MDLENANNLGMHWAAIRNDSAVAVIPMFVPNDVDFELFRERAVSALRVLGDVTSGEVFDNFGERCFVPRPSNADRSNNPRPKKQLSIFQPSEILSTGGYQ